MFFRTAFRTAFLIILASCSDNNSPSVPDCKSNAVSTPTLSVTDASSCTAVDGKIVVTASGGIPPYSYSLNGAAFKTSNTFEALPQGSYQVTVQDSRGCTAAKTASVNAVGSTLAATSSTTKDSQCFPPHDGAVNIIPSGGTAPYQVSFNNGSFGSSTNFNGLDAGSYRALVKDAEGCLVTLDVEVGRADTGVSYSADIQPLLSTFCGFPACHGAGNGSRSWTNYANVSAAAQNIKLRTGNKSMPPSGQTGLSDQQIQLIACWVDGGAKNN